MAQRSISYKGHTFLISYEIKNPKSSVDAVVLHGWGSNKEIMKRSFSLLPFRQIYIDLPGFGKSTNEIVLTTKDYANIIALFIDSIGAKRDIVIGHSFGGKIATLLEPKLLVLLSSAGIVEKKPLSVRAKIALYKALKPFGIKKVKNLFVSDDAKGMSENMYETFKNVVNEDFSSHFANFSGRALLFWGKSDRATPPSSAKKIASLLPNSSLYLLDGDHYFFLHHGEFIMQKIKEEYEKL